MKRKFLIVLLAIVCVFCFSFAVAACGSSENTDDGGNGEITNPDDGQEGNTTDPDDDEEEGSTTEPDDGEEHVHEWGEWELTTEPECEVEGEETRVCKLDESHTETRPVDPLDHDWDEWELTTEPKCETDGEETRVCKHNSLHTETRKVDPIGHDITDAHTDFYSHDGLCGRCLNQISAKHSFNTLNVCTECVYEIIPSEGLKYTEQATYDGVEYSVSQGDFWGTDLVIPYYYNGYPVVTIGSYAFANCVTLKTAHIPDSVTSILYGAFNKCTLLESIEISDNVKSIGMYAFSDCKNLAKINLPSSLTKIEDSLLKGCEKITEIVIPEGVEKIDAFAFGYTAITSINVPASVTNINNYAFAWAEKLESVTVSEDNTKYASQDGIVYNKAKTIINNVPEALKGEVTLSDRLVIIESRTFEDFAYLESVIIPDSVAYINESAFYGCKNLQKVVMGNGVIEIGNSAFKGCYNLEQINLSNKLTKIGRWAFDSCSIKSLVIPASVTSIGMRAFLFCYDLKSLTFENPNGWWYSYDEGATSGTAIPASELSNPATAAEKLTDLYSYGGYYLYRS